METNIYFVRHAHSKRDLGNEQRRTLSDIGYRDANRVYEIMRKEEIDVVISSNYVRAVDTVQGIANHIGVEVITDERFRERDLAGEYVFANDEHRLAMIRSFEDENYTYPGGESHAAVKHRGIKALTEILNTYMGKNVVIGIHGNIMAVIMNHFDKKFDYDFWRTLSKPDIYKLSFDQNKELLDVIRIWNEHYSYFS